MRLRLELPSIWNYSRPQENVEHTFSWEGHEVSPRQPSLFLLPLLPAFVDPRELAILSTSGLSTVVNPPDGKELSTALAVTAWA